MITIRERSAILIALEERLDYCAAHIRDCDDARKNSGAVRTGVEMVEIRGRWRRRIESAELARAAIMAIEPIT